MTLKDVRKKKMALLKIISFPRNKVFLESYQNTVFNILEIF